MTHEDASTAVIIAVVIDLSPMPPAPTFVRRTDRTNLRRNVKLAENIVTQLIDATSWPPPILDQ